MPRASPRASLKCATVASSAPVSRPTLRPRAASATGTETLFFGAEAIVGEAKEAVSRIAASLTANALPRPDVAGHRIVHRGPALRHHVRIDAGIRRQLDAARAFAPLQVPVALALLDVAQASFPDTPQVASIDTAFPVGMPDVARTLPLPRELRAIGETTRSPRHDRRGPGGARRPGCSSGRPGHVGAGRRANCVAQLVDCDLSAEAGRSHASLRRTQPASRSTRRKGRRSYRRRNRGCPSRRLAPLPRRTTVREPGHSRALIPASGVARFSDSCGNAGAASDVRAVSRGVRRSHSSVGRAHPW